MRTLRSEHAGPRWTALVATTGSVALGAAVAIVLLRSAPASGYPRYSVNGDATNCRACHGDFRANAPYVSLSDGAEWISNLHNSHRTTMLNNDCDVCHGATTFPVELNNSVGGVGFPGISCLGCHGRQEGAAVTGAGLRQHHDRAGVAVCRTCHADANPASFTPVGEHVKPPYYMTPDELHPGKPTDPCNANGSESAVAPPKGLDNDGDLTYDGGDADCSAVGVEDPAAIAPLRLEGAQPNPSREPLKVAFVLPNAQPASLEVLDLAGRRIVRRQVGSLGAGRHVVELSGQRALSPGVYVLRLIQGTRSQTARVVVID